MMSTIKTGLLAFGTSGKLFHAPFLNTHPRFELTGVVERKAKNAHELFPGITSYNSVDELMADREIELLIINTPNATHFEFALQAIRAGKHVLVEKPFTITVEEAKLLFGEGKSANLHVLVYQNRRFDTDFLSVKQVIESGRLGRLVEVHFRFDRYRYAIGAKVEKETPGPGSGLLYDLGPHLLDQVISLFGTPLRWKKTMGHFRPGTRVNDYASIHLEYRNELQVFITLSMLVADPQPAFVIHGTTGSYIKKRSDTQEKQLLAGLSPGSAFFGREDENTEGILTTIAQDGAKITEKITQASSSYMQLFDRIFDTIRRNQSYPVTTEQILLQLEILES